MKANLNIYACSPIRCFKYLQMLRKKENSKKFSELYGFMFFTVSQEPYWAVSELFTLLMTYAQRNGIIGLEGLYLTLLNMASKIHKSQFERGFNIWELVEDELDAVASADGMSIHFMDMNFSRVQNSFKSGNRFSNIMGYVSDGSVYITGFPDFMREQFAKDEFNQHFGQGSFGGFMRQMGNPYSEGEPSAGGVNDHLRYDRCVNAWSLSSGLFFGVVGAVGGTIATGFTGLGAGAGFGAGTGFGFIAGEKLGRWKCPTGASVIPNSPSSSGNSGTSGSDGNSGSSGTNGNSDTSGSSGTSGNSDTSGSSGTSGSDSNSGSSSTGGSDGTSGTDSSSGGGDSESGMTNPVDLAGTTPVDAEGKNIITLQDVVDAFKNAYTKRTGSLIDPNPETTYIGGGSYMIMSKDPTKVQQLGQWDPESGSVSKYVDLNNANWSSILQEDISNPPNFNLGNQLR